MNPNKILITITNEFTIFLTMFKFCLCVALFGLLGGQGWAQTHVHKACETETNNHKKLRDDPNLQERYLQIERLIANYTASNVESRSEVIIPVVVHVVYSSPVENLSKSQIYSQIEVLNRDFNALNSDIQALPPMFHNIKGNSNIRFQLAARDPNGFASDGINRVPTTKKGIGESEDVKFKAKGGADAWDAESYLNIWVCSTNGKYAGTAQYPGGNLISDGIVVDYRYFGTIGAVKSPMHLGRTCTHEVGHWLGLRHLWGDSYCGDDFVADTPPQEKPTQYSNGFPLTTQCNGAANIAVSMNYMDYVSDDQMYFFTAGQCRRMRAILSPGGARGKLVESDGWKPATAITCNSRNAVWFHDIGASTFTVSCMPVQNTTYYYFQYRADTISNYTEIVTQNPTANIPNLKANSRYYCRVGVMCSTAKNWSDEFVITTLSKTEECKELDIYEPNNTIQIAKKISLNSTLQGKIGSIDDKDFYEIRTTDEQPNFIVTLENMYLDYDVKLFGANMQLLQVTQNSAGKTENLVFNANKAGVYYIQIFGYNNTFDKYECYKLSVYTSKIKYPILINNNAPIKEDFTFVLRPNPAQDIITVSTVLEDDKNVNWQIINITGKTLDTGKAFLNKETSNLTIDISQMTDGFYFLQLNIDGRIYSRRFLKQN